MDQEIRPNEAVQESFEKTEKRGRYSLWIRVIAVILVIAMVLGMLTSVDFSLMQYQGTEQMVAAQYLADNTSYIGENRFQRLKSLLTGLDSYSINQQAAEIAIGKMDYERAATFLNRCIPLSTDADETAELYIRLGCVHMLSENRTGAGQAFDRSIEINPEKPVPYLLRAQLRYQDGDADGAAEDALAYLELGGKDIDMLSTAASICELAGNLENAAEAMTMIIRGTSDSYDKALAYAERGRLKYLMGEDEAAAEDVAEAKELNEIVLTGVHYAIIGLWEYDTGDYENAGEDFLMAARLSDEGNSGYFEQAVLCGYLSENTPFAAETIREAKEKGMMTANSYLIEGIILFSEERYEDGEAALSASLDTGTTVVGAYYYRGLCRLAAGKYADAALDFTEAINWEESDLACIFNRGVCYYALEDYESAYYDLEYVAINDSDETLAASAQELLDTLVVVELPEE